ncbi:hypothetical protein IW146_006272 [Coemansia sp. RSA 922]|nr:hypothetical protein IW146_006272 [Coemansia sp. RSA 922]
MFIQEAGQFGPHPNMSDPRLVSSRIPIVQWEGVCLSKSSDIVISAACSEGRIPELKYEPDASWAIVLENHAYTWGNTPAHIPRISTSLLGRFYNPPLLRNDFTKSKPKSKPLTKLNDKGLATDEYPTTIDVEFELSGIRQGWVLARARLDGHLRPTLKTVQIKKPVPAPWDPTKSVMAKFTELAYTTDKGVSDPAAPEDVPLPHTNLVDPVVATRRSVDEVVMYYLYLLTIPTILTAIVYYMLLPQEYSLSSLGYLKEFLIVCIRIIQSVAWLPQILVNYKSKSGSLMPVPFVLHMLAYTIASTITYQLSGYSVFGELAAYSLPVHLSYVILFVQWIMYRKVKQD